VLGVLVALEQPAHVLSGGESDPLPLVDQALRRPLQMRPDALLACVQRWC
jgi:hypothetical protein